MLKCALMTPRGKIYAGIGLILVAGIVFGAYSFVSKRSKKSASNATTAQASSTQESVAAASMPQPGEGSISPIQEPTALTPKKTEVTPPPEPPLPVGTDRFTVSLNEMNDDIASSLATGGYISDAANFTAML